jgi:hypothetical protein
MKDTEGVVVVVGNNDDLVISQDISREPDEETMLRQDRCGDESIETARAFRIAGRGST